MRSNRGLFALAMTMARHRAGALLAIGVAVAGGSTMVAAAGVLAQTGIVSSAPVGWLADADVVVSAEQYVVQDEDLDVPLPERVGVDAGLLSELADLPEVDRAAGRLGVPVAIPSTDAGDEAGSNWEFAMLGSPSVEGTAPQSADEVGLTGQTADVLGVAVGDTIELVVAGEPGPYRVTAVADTPGLGVLMADAVADRLRGNADKVDLIGIVPATNVPDAEEAIAAHVDGSGLLVSSGDARGDVAHLEAGPARGMLIGLSGSLGGTLVMTVGFIVAAAVAVMVNQQRRQIALLRACGATARQVRRLIATQATTVAIAAAVPGAAAGYALAGPLATWFTDAGLLPASLPPETGPVPGLITVGLVALGAQVAARLASMRLSGMPATEAIAESTVEPREPSKVRAKIGFVLIAVSMTAALAPLFARNEAGFIGSASTILLACIGFALASPTIVRWFTVRRAARSASLEVSRWLAVHNSRSYAVRTAGAITVLALAIALAVVQIFVTTTLGEVVNAQRTDGNRMDALVTADAAGGLTEQARHDLADSPGVEAAIGSIATTLIWPYVSDGRARAEEVGATAFSSPPEPVVDLGLVDGDLGMLTGDAIAMDADKAWFEGVSVGDRVELITDDGITVNPVLVATYQRGFGFGTVVTTTGLISADRLRLYDSVLATGDVEAVEDWAAGRHGAVVGSGADLTAGGGISGDRWISLALTMVLLGYVVMAGGNNLIATTTRRRGELSLLRLIGATPSQVFTMMRKETRLICLLATAGGLALSLPSVVLLGLGLLGRPWPQGPLWAIPALVAVICAVAYPAIMVPAGRAMRSSPVESLADR